MNLFLITFFVRSYQEFCCLYTSTCRIIHTSYFWHSILQIKHAFRYTIHAKRRNDLPKSLKKRKNQQHFSSSPVYMKACTRSTRALYGRYTGLVASVQRPCSIRTEPLYENISDKTTAQNSHYRFSERSQTLPKRPRKAVCLPKIVSQMVDISKSICTFALLTADFRLCGVSTRMMFFRPAQFR